MVRFTDTHPVNCYLLNVTPNELRKIADILDAQLKNAYPGQTVLLPITDMHTICITASKIASEGKLQDSKF